MIYPQMLLDLHDQLIVDLFAGGGGASCGIEMATGRQVDIAVNHDAAAVALHRVNHPQTEHHVCDVFEVDPRAVTAGRSIGLLWACPDCTFHSKARGGKPLRSKESQRRALAWVVTRWAGQVRPRVIMLENVEEFAEWGPLVGPPDAQRPCKKRRGKTFRQWVRSLERLGYDVEWRELRACDYGAPTIRKRLFLIARCDGEPIAWPAKTHGPGRGLKPYRTAAECIDWSIPMLSIFATREEAKVWARAHYQKGAPVRPLADATMRRIARGVVRYVVDSPKPYIVGVGGRQGQSPERPLDRPMQTITAKGDSALIAPVIAQMAHGEGSGKTKRWGVGATATDAPLPTITASGGASLVAAHLSSYHAEKRDGDTRAAAMDDPTATIDTANRHALVSAFLAQNNAGYYSGDGRPVTEPNGTVLASGSHQSLIAASLVKNKGTISAADPRDPLHTIMSGGTHHGVGAAHIQRDFGRSVGSPADSPVGTITAGAGGHAGLVAANLSHNYTSNTNGGAGDPEEPLKTVTTGGHAALVASFLAKYYGTGDGAEVSDPAPTVTTKDRFGLVTVDLSGEPYIIVDIAMRMLQPRELYNAQGFPPEYIIDRGADGRRLTKTEQVRMCGNSVPPQFAAALARANVPELAARDEVAA